MNGPSPTMGSASRAGVYRRLALAALPRFLGTLDREPWSPTSGSFDRDHWGWQFRDFPVTMLQAGVVPLAAVWSGAWAGNPYARSERLRDWIVSALEATLRRQHRNGAFDSVAPFTQDHGVTLQMAHAFATTLNALGDAIPDALRSRLRDAVALACRFALRSDEDYAFISNHRALFALAWLRAGRLLDDAAMIARAEHEVRAIVARQSREGWYAEYGGADPGYQSLGMAYLAQVHREHPLDDLGASLQRAVAWMSFFVHPDGGLGGTYGSRLTSLWFPSGFELLSATNPLAGAVAGAAAHGILRAAVVTPDTSDAHNLPPLLQSYLVAADVAAARPDDGAVQSLPREELRGTRYFDEAGMVVAGSDRYYAVVNLRRGGVGVIHARASGGLVWEDAGYVATSAGDTYSSALDTASNVTQGSQPGTFSLETRFTGANREVLTPGRFLLLRLANLTLFRSVALGAAIRRMIIGRLITQRRNGPLLLRRVISFGDDHVKVRDELRGDGRGSVEQLARTRSFAPFHMGSSRYFHDKDLTVIPGSEDRLDAAVLRTAGKLACGHVIRVDADGRGEVIFSADGS